MDPSVNPNCPKCDETPPHTGEHWLDCRGTLQARLEIFETRAGSEVERISPVPFPGRLS